MASPAPSRSPARDLASLLAFLGVCFAVAALGGAVTSTSVGTWYQTLHKPIFNPPDWIFAPVWTALYFMMAVAGWRIWRRAGWSGGSEALLLFGIQLALTLSWSLLFFGLRRISAALICCVALWLAVAATAATFRWIDRTAAWLMVPCLVWISFATVLNFAIWRLN